MIRTISFNVLKYNSVLRNTIGCSHQNVNQIITTVVKGIGTSATSHNAEKPGFLNRIFGWGSSSQSKLKISSYYLYETVADQLNYADFFERFHLPNTFNSWFLVTELHVWMLLVRAMAEGSERDQNGRFMRNSIVESMWNDVSSRAKKLGAHNPGMVRKQTDVLGQQFQAALINYDEGILKDDKVLAGALWRRFFQKECDDLQQLELLVHYVRAQIHMLDNLDTDQFVMKSKVRWISLADFGLEPKKL